MKTTYFIHHHGGIMEMFRKQGGIYQRWGLTQTRPNYLEMSWATVSYCRFQDANAVVLEMGLLELMEVLSVVGIGNLRELAMSI